MHNFKSTFPVSSHLICLGTTYLSSIVADAGHFEVVKRKEIKK